MSSIVCAMLYSIHMWTDEHVLWDNLLSFLITRKLGVAAIIGKKIIIKIDSNDFAQILVKREVQTF